MTDEILGVSERIIDARVIEPAYRHRIIQQLVEQLVPGTSLQLIADHMPRPLRHQIELRFGSRCSWSYLEEGPDVWRVRILKNEVRAATEDRLP